MNDGTSFEFVRVHPGGLLLDLTSGSLFRLNESAAFIWEAWLRGATAQQVASDLERSYNLPPSTAEEHVAAALKIDPAEGTPGPPSGEFLYERTTDGYVFSRGGTPFLLVDHRGEQLRLYQPARMSPSEVAAALTAVAPKLVALQGHFVLHAAAVLLDGAAIVVAGDSGAGKTTTARALVRAGASPLAEDKLVIRETPGGPTVFQACEQNIERWALGTHADLSRGGVVPCPDVNEICTGPAVPIREIGFIEATRRMGRSISAVKLTTLDGSGALFRNSFCGSDAAADWTKILRTATTVAEATDTYDLTMPAGIGELEAAASVVLATRSLRSK
jgi:hypothetical protein